MRTSDKGICEIAAHEGIVPYPYRDSVGVWTVGIGHTASAGAPDPSRLPRGKALPMAEVMEIFRRDLRRFEARVNAAVKVPVAQHEFDALVSFDFNTGGINRAALTKALNQGNRKAAAEGFMGWLKPPEIKERRHREQALFRDGTYSNDGRAPTYTADKSGKVNWGSAKRVNVAAALAGQPVPKPQPKPAPEYTRDEIRDVQRMLLKHGYVQVGGIDGLVGDNTRGGIRDFRDKNELPPGSHIDDALIEALKRPDAVRPVIAPERANATLSELRDKGSVIADSSKKSGKGAIATVVAGVGAVGTQIVDSAGGLMNLGPALEPFRWLIEEYGVWIFGTTIAGLGGFFWWQARRSGDARLKDHKSGNTSVVNLHPDE